MLRSMTAFARQQSQGEWGVVTWEIRSVNHRYLEPHFRLPDNLRDLEPKLRDILRQRVGRGKVECSLKFQPSAAGVEQYQLNLELVKELNNAANQINRILDNPAHLSALDFMQWPGVLTAQEVSMEPVKDSAMACFSASLDELLATREREGAQLLPLLDQRLQSITEIVSEVRAKLPTILKNQSANIKARFDEAKVDLDNDRLEQEMVLLAQKSDVDEELDRLEAHVNEVSSVLRSNEPIGRRLDFLMQELNREANTLSSKSIVADTTRAAVELKVLIEQMREQVQNIE